MGQTKTERRFKIQRRYRDRIEGTVDQPRMSVFRSNKEIYAQIVNDTSGITIVSASSRDKDFESHKGSKIELASLVGKTIAEKAIKAGISTIRFDRGGYLYHGRVKS